MYLLVKDENFVNSWFKQFENREVSLFGKFNRANLYPGIKHILDPSLSGQYGFVVSTKDGRNYYLKIEIDYDDQKKATSAVQNFVRYFKIGAMKDLQAMDRAHRIGQKKVGGRSHST